MICKITHLIISIAFIFFNCYPANSQLSFNIDSLDFMRYGDSHLLSSWEKSSLFFRGPDVIVYGQLNNNGESPIILELSEICNDEVTIHRQLLLYVYYHDKKDYYYLWNPLFATHITDGISLPGNMVSVNGKVFFYSIIGAGESIPLSFETLSKPQKDIKVRRKCQRRVIKAIESSIRIIPIIHDLSDSLTVKVLLPLLLRQKEMTSQESYYDMSIPQFFLDKKPSFNNGGLSGFYEWLTYSIESDPLDLSGKECQIMLSFIVSMDGNVVYSKVFYSDPEVLSEAEERHIADILKHSPQWSAGELHGVCVYSRITLRLFIDINGKIKEVTMMF